MTAVAEDRRVTGFERELTKLDGRVVEIPLDEIAPAPDNPRGDVGDVTELAQSIKQIGLLEPLVVTPRPGGFLLVCGARRHAAARLAGLDTVTALVRELDEVERQAAMLVENLQREDLSPIEEANGYQRLVELGENQRAIASRVGKTQSHISKRLALLELPPYVRAEVDSGGITLDDARELLRLKDMPKRLKAAFDAGRKRGEFEWPVDQQLREHEVAETIGQAQQQLKQAGTRIVEFKKHPSWEQWDLPSGMLRLDSWEARELKISPAGHAKEPCHAAAIRPRDGEIVYLCTKPAAHKNGGVAVPESEQEARRQERAREKQQSLRAREKNIQLGELLAAKLQAPAIDERNMRLLVDLLMLEVGAELAWSSFRYVDEASQTVVTKKDGAVSRIVHVEGLAARALLDERLKAAKTPEELMGVVLQALIAARYADRNAVPASQRQGYVAGVHSQYGPAPLRATLEKLAAPIVGTTKRPKEPRR